MKELKVKALSNGKDIKVLISIGKYRTYMHQRCAYASFHSNVEAHFLLDLAQKYSFVRVDGHMFKMFFSRQNIKPNVTISRSSLKTSFLSVSNLNWRPKVKNKHITVWVSCPWNLPHGEENFRLVHTSILNFVQGFYFSDHVTSINWVYML